MRRTADRPLDQGTSIAHKQDIEQRGEQRGDSSSSVQQVPFTPSGTKDLPSQVLSHTSDHKGRQQNSSAIKANSHAFESLVEVSQSFSVTHSVMTTPTREDGPVPLHSPGHATGTPGAAGGDHMAAERQRDHSDAHEEQQEQPSNTKSGEAVTEKKRPKRSTRTRKSYHYDSDDDEFDYPSHTRRSPGVAFAPPIEKKTKSAKKAYIRGKTCRTKGRFCRVCGNKDAIQWRRGPDGRLSLCNACGLRYRSFVKQEKHIPVNENPSRISIASLLQSGSPGPVTRPS